MRKDVWVWAGVVALILLLVGLWVWKGNTQASGTNDSGIESSTGSNGSSTKPDGKGVTCAQVITSAKNLATGEVREFSTPCDVPEGWEVVQPGVIE